MLLIYLNLYRWPSAEIDERRRGNGNAMRQWTLTTLTRPLPIRFKLHSYNIYFTAKTKTVRGSKNKTNVQVSLMGKIAPCVLPRKQDRILTWCIKASWQEMLLNKLFWYDWKGNTAHRFFFCQFPVSNIINKREPNDNRLERSCLRGSKKSELT